MKKKRVDYPAIAIRIEDDLRERFTALCKARKYSRSEIVEKLVKIYVDNADENGWTEYIETRCISCQRIFTQEKLIAERYCSPECHLLFVVFKRSTRYGRSLESNHEKWNLG